MAEDTRSGEVAPSVSGADIRTFLFADMRGYTRFTQDHGDEAASALAGRFADLVRETVPEFEGELLELRGDEALCVFRSARQALRASIELQRQLRTATEDEPAFPLGVGIGLDAGEAVPTQGGYRGASLNLAARLCAQAKPGEILVSETVTGLSSRVDGLRFLEGRSATLKGMTRPVRYVVVEPDDPFPALLAKRTPSGRQRRWIIAAGAALGLMGVAAAVTFLSRSSGQHRPVPGDVVAAVNATGSLVSDTAIGGEPSAIAVGRDAIWVADAGTNTIYEVNPTSKAIVDRIAVGHLPDALVVDQQGRLWVANDGDGTVWWIDPHAATPVRLQVAVGNGPIALAAGLGAVWVANRLDDTVSRIDPARGKVTQTIPLPSAPAALAVSGGSLWVATDGANSVLQFDAHGKSLGPVPIADPVALASSGPVLWVASQADGTVSRIVNGKITNTVPVGRTPSAVAATPNAVWVADQLASTLSRIDPRDPNHVASTLSLEAEPNTLAAGSNSTTWVTTLPALREHRGGTLRVAAISSYQGLADITTIDPQLIFFYTSAVPPVWDVYDGLVGYRRIAGSGGATLVPDLATSIPTPTNAGRIWTFHLRPHLVYSDGRPVKASDIDRAVERLFRVGSPAATYFTFSHLIGASPCIQRLNNILNVPGKPAPPPYPACDLSSAITTNDRAETITFHLNSPDPVFLDELAEPYADPVPPGTPNHDVGTHPIPGTGPYEITSFEKGGQIMLSRNRRFHVWSEQAQPAGLPDHIVIRGYPSPDAEYRAVEQHRADISWDSTVTGASTPAVLMGRLALRFPNQLKVSPYPIIQFLYLNTTRGPLRSALVRRAISYAINRHRAVAFWGGPERALPTCQYLPIDFPAYHPYCPSTISPTSAGTYTGPDLATAQHLVAESGMRGESVTYSEPTPAGPRDRQFGNYIASMLHSIGLNGKANARPTHNPQAFLGGWIEDFPLASDFIQPLFSCASALNSDHFCSQAIDRRIRQAETAQQSNPAASDQAWSAIEHTLLTEPPAIPLVQQQWVNLVSRRVGNYQLHLLLGPLLDQMWVK